ncbi:NAD-dependent deacylase [Mesorhizobium sp. CU2]|uniref:NAD-dependent deacylase n=1 Tax=unclassified Mesorhizobium TaxID=325217 RepID=UPI001129FC19|nr:MULTISPECIES: NAD-dependent deacylase [unclassified Mesorhizobium]TPN83285.1 NAD-dependent deacylase [Mesorhizobium sp. CU3]TPO05363.1 NAD-dependent deacylase [Mesorhizobium sp. CU2]
MSKPKIVILTGAGISAESGVATFRDPNGVWANFDLEEVATPQGFARNPAKVQDFYNMRRRQIGSVEPNAAHEALARLEQAFPDDVLVVTQNIDDLHERAGSRKLIHMHGELGRALCLACGESHPWKDDIAAQSKCPGCGAAGRLRPDVVWFGEMPYRMEEIGEALGGCDLFAAIGTSGSVYPAAGFVEEARTAGALTVELNLKCAGWASRFDEQLEGPATQVVPAFVERILSGKG